MAVIRGDADNNGLYGTTGDDSIFGEGGNDYLVGYAGNDTLDGGEGNDVLSGGPGVDSLSGGTGDDTLYGGVWEDGTHDTLIDGGDGTDYAEIYKYLSTIALDFSVAGTAAGELVDDTLVRGVERVYFLSGSGDDIIVGGDLADYISGGGGSDVLVGGGGRDLLLGDAGANELYGGDGTDELYSSDAADLLVDGGDGIDIAVVSRIYTSTGLTFTLDPTNITYLGGTALRNVERLYFEGGSGNDHITGGTLGDQLRSGDGDDTLNGGGGADYLDGGRGVDFAYVNEASSTSNMTLDLLQNSSIQTVGGTRIVNVERIEFVGGSGNDRITGHLYDDILSGNGGIDRLVGGGGNDVLNGGADGDYLDGEAGVDSLYGGAGDDTLVSYSYPEGQDAVIDGGEGLDSATISRFVQSGALTLSIANPSVTAMLGTTAVRGIERLDYTGGRDVDTITGGARADVLRGDSGADVLDGGAGDDTLEGGDDNDVLEGGSGSDQINGGRGIDTARYAGGRADYLVVRNGDELTVTDRFAGGIVRDRVFDVEVFTFSDGTYYVDANYAPTAIALDDRQVREDAPVGTVVGTARGADADLIETLTYSLADDAGGRFAIDAASGEITVRDATLIDFESAASHDIVVRVRDAAGNSIDQAFTIAVLDVTEYVGINTPDGSYTASTDADYSVTGGTGANAITTAGGDDRVLGAGGDDAIATGGGDDTIVYEGLMDGYDSVDGGAGTDRIVAARDGTAIGLTSFTGIEAISADGHAGVFIRATGRSEVLDFTGVTLDGIVRIDAGTGNDTVTGSAGADNILGGGGNDLLRGGDGDDVFLVGRGDGVDRIEGGDGYDTIRAIEDGTAIGVQWFTGLEAIDGGGFANVTILGSTGADALNLTDLAVTGISRIDLGAGDDRFRGSAGADRVVGGKGDDMLLGNGGDDVFEIAAGAGNDTIDGGDGFDTLLVAAPVFVWSNVANVEAVTGTALRLTGTAAADTLDFSGVTLTGVTRIDAGLGDDSVTGSAGEDRIALSDGRDVLAGGTGADVFVFERLAQSRVAAADLIADYVAGEDRIDLTALDASTRTAGDQAFAFVGTAAFTGVAGELRYDVSGGVTSVSGDINGDRRADFQLDLKGALALTETDFLL